MQFKSRSEPGLDQAVISPFPQGVGLESVIGSQLRAMYRELLEQPVPDQLAELIDRFEQSQHDHQQSKGASQDGTKS
jgi:hypothetical protein